MSHLAGLVSEAQPTSVPWNAERALSVVVSNVISFAAIVVGAIASGRTDDPQDALLWLNVSIAGLVFAGVANGTWIMRARRTLARGRAFGLDLVAEHVAAGVAVAVPVDGSGMEALVWAPGTTRYHLGGCAFAAGRSVETLGPAEVSDRALRPCEVCRP